MKSPLKPMMTMRLLQSVLFCCALVPVSSLQAKPVKTAGDVKIDEAKIEIMLREQRARGVSDSPELRKAIRQSLVVQAAIANEARKVDLHKTPLVQAQIELAQQNVLVQAWQQKVLVDRPPRDDEIKMEYDRQLTTLGSTDFRLRHILVKDESTANDLINKIKGGAKLADLARENSLDAQTRERGGAADWTNVSQLLPPLAEALKLLANGQLAPQPVKTDAGWHVLQREDSRLFQAMSYEQAKPQMQAIVARRILDQYINKLIESTGVKK